MKYKVTYREYFTKVIEIEAESDSQAWDIAEELYESAEVVLGVEDFDECEWEVEGVEEED
jgi:hypothetical protein